MSVPRIVELRGHDADDNHAAEHSTGTRDEKGLAADLVDEHDGGDCHGNIYDANDAGGEDGNGV